MTFFWLVRFSDEFTGLITDIRIPKSKIRHVLNNLILEVKNITKEVNSPEGLLTIVEDINLVVEKDKSISLVGPSGSGKSTLIKTINALEPFQQGEIFIDGVAVHDPRTDMPKLAKVSAWTFRFQLCANTVPDACMTKPPKMRATFATIPIIG
ncbi:MAG: ATP-binding cassette domain-containing protein [Proteobacteria bacterium]|nr:ATP-binding cassette domain-containing protein [Pseudomonadota bacterium]